MKPERFLTATLGGEAGLLAPTERDLKLFDQVATDMENGSVQTLMAMLSPKDQPPLTDDQKLRAASVLAKQDVAALAAIARSLPDLAITETEAGAIKVPTMAIIGTADPRMEGVNKLKKALPTLKVVPIEKATHASALGRPEFIAALETFLKAPR